MHRIWSLQGEPLRPPAEAVARMVAAAGPAASGRALALGVTPEFHAAFANVTALDASPGMIATVWPGDTATHRAVAGDWVTDIPALGRFDLCLGDLSLSQLPADRARQVLGAVAGALRPRGRVVLRSVCRPDAPVTEAAIRAHADAPGFNFHGLRLMIALHLAQGAGAEVPVRAIHDSFCRLFPDREDFLRRTGLPPDRMILIDHYATSALSWWVPSRDELLELARGAGLEGRIAPSGDYPFAPDLPLFLCGG
jgi:SAM-dependent methyltransferase